jgi:hypothetical protein
MIEDTAAIEYAIGWSTPPPDMAMCIEPHARYAAGQVIAAYFYRVPLEAVIADTGTDRHEVILWPVLYPTDTYRWGRVIVFLAGREAVAVGERTEHLPVEMMPDSWWDYEAPVTRATRLTDAMRAWQIIQVIHVPLRARRNELYRRARQQAYALFLDEVNRAALSVLERHLGQRREITGMEAMAIVGSVVARLECNPARPPQQ